MIFKVHLETIGGPIEVSGLCPQRILSFIGFMKGVLVYGQAIKVSVYLTSITAILIVYSRLSSMKRSIDNSIPDCEADSFF